MAIDICQACGCCNHCNSRHDGDTDEARCPLDPEVTQEEVRQSLRDAGVSDEEQDASWDRTVVMLEHLQKAYRLKRERDEARAETERQRDLLDREYARALRAERQVTSLRAASVDDLRDAGWSVAVHNDYCLAGEQHTFWLLTHPSGRWLKGEGPTDTEALNQIRTALKENS
jgi:hypothetical protein